MYKYEMHCHTSETSRCGKVSAAEMVDFYKSMGYSGLVISDHFLNGNTVVPKELPWEKRINQFCAGYEAAKKRGDEIGLPVSWLGKTHMAEQIFLHTGSAKNGF